MTVNRNVLLSCFCLPAIAFAGSNSLVAQTPNEIVEVVVDPATITLDGPRARFSLLVDAKTKDGRVVDLTRDALYESANPACVVVSPTGQLSARADGQTQINITVAGRTRRVLVTAKNSQVPQSFNFENDIVPILSRFGCNSSGCHGKAEGQNGFKLSVFGFDPPADHAALTQEGRGRRVNPAVPANSLLLLKGAGGLPHGGGVRIRRNSGDYRALHEWIRQGTPVGSAADSKVVSISVTPGQRQLSMNASQQMRVVATYSDNREIDVTFLAKFQSNNDAIATVDEFGLVSTLDVPGEVAVMASYMGSMATFRILIPLTPTDVARPDLPVVNFIDTHVDRKLALLNIVPSGLCTDADYLRRVYLDVIGTLPTATEARKFLEDKSPNKRATLVDELLQRPEFADFWALKWSDLLRVDRLALGHKQAYAYYRWIRQAMADNLPYDEFARQVVAPTGLVDEAPAANLYKVAKNPGAMSSTISQVFLGIRIECAQCHHHPYDRWSQTDYYGMQSYFSQLAFKASPTGEMVKAEGNPTTKHPRSGIVVHAHPLGTVNPETSPDGDRRQHLAAWMTAADNSWFARNFVNRAFAHFMGRGIIEPVDDVRLTNPPTNPELLEELSRHFIQQKYDFHALIRTLTASRTYQLSSSTNASNESDEQNYSRALFKRMSAEVAFDAICQTTGIPEKFDGVPAGSRAIQLWDSQTPHYFLKLFGRPFRATACECERSIEPTVSQVLHVLNSPEIQGKLSHAGGRVRKLVVSHKSNSGLVDELYLTFYSRLPVESERNATVRYLESHATQRQRAAEDIAWSMMNTVEFLFNH
ncbi:MAG: DUF1549 domain-containing protein [Planctomycetota bacterium]|nr:DUF1549 domain-containing protein [Planctomycetota bacterium]